MADQINKWSAGAHYGPVLSQTDLYLLNTDLELHPIMAGKDGGFHLVFNVVTGQTSGFNPDARDRDLQFTAKDQPATLPRVSSLIIITEASPWCTVVQNERGVTMDDICIKLYRDYSEHNVTDAEFAALAPRLQEQVKRMAAHNAAAGAGPGGAWGNYYGTPAAPPARFKRSDWLRERTFFEGLRKNDGYAVSRLGFKAPNIFVMDLVA
ncbi:hypothetical protein MIND_00997300 [Mycena indigotica]|uniref:DUF6699 domain-containing protein n=1 Tax=Mycena indigotica TaxID=2126181 RepID=A0A8H6S911_9AGAR|nr:uncharacterized protein MIND_00997300 [Mycena indigotica]KAF7294607.1 hypothetical protein MIND_00997300 [Mycena indigotica]